MLNKCGEGISNSVNTSQLLTELLTATLNAATVDEKTVRMHNMNIHPQNTYSSEYGAKLSESVKP